MKKLQLARACQLCLIALYIFICPYTKVEESFNLQALHDLHQSGRWLRDAQLRNESDPVAFVLSQYDHLEFPGVVPRTFIGALATYSVSFPFLVAMGMFAVPKFWGQLVVRCGLGWLFWVSQGWLTHAITARHGQGVSFWFTLATCSQFHILFYASRTLPNTFSTILVSVALSYIVLPRDSSISSSSLRTGKQSNANTKKLNQRKKTPLNVKDLCNIHNSPSEGNITKAISLLVFITVVLRCDTIVLLGTITLSLLATRHVSIIKLITVGAVTGVLSLAMSVAIDSFFWQQGVIWPEGTVLYFNTVLNKSKEWGVMPPMWYFTSALPRALLLCYPMILGGVVRLAFHRNTRIMLWLVVLPCIAFVGLLSILPHKELRFIMPALPAFNYVAGLALDWEFFGKYPKLKWFADVSKYSILALNMLVTLVFFLAASKVNYPGALALGHVHQLAVAPQSYNSCSVHISPGAAISGISRFLQEEQVHGVEWRYSKDESLISPSDLVSVDYVITEHPAAFDLDSRFEKVKTVYGAPHFNVQRLQFDLTPQLFVFATAASECYSAH